MQGIVVLIRVKGLPTDAHGTGIWINTGQVHQDQSKSRNAENTRLENTLPERR